VHLSKHILNYRKKQTGTLRFSENITFTSDDVMDYVLGTHQQKLPRAPLPFNPVLIVYDINSAIVHGAKSVMFCMAGILWISWFVNSVA